MATQRDFDDVRNALNDGNTTQQVADQLGWHVSRAAAVLFALQELDLVWHALGRREPPRETLWFHDTGPIAGLTVYALAED